MLSWLAVNLGTIVVATILIIIVAVIVRKLYSDKKKGIHSCGGNCGGGCAGCNGCNGCANHVHK